LPVVVMGSLSLLFCVFVLRADLALRLQFAT